MRIATILFGVMTFAAPLKAAAIVYEFSGVVDWVYEPGDEFNHQVHAGDSFLAKFTFDTASPDLRPDDPHVGDYAGGPAWLSVSGFSLSLGPIAGLGLTDGPSQDLLDLQCYGGLHGVFLSFTGPASAFSGDALPVELPRLLSGYLLQVESSLPPPSHAKFGGHVTSVLVTPEPVTLCLLACGLLFADRFRRRGSKGVPAA